MTSYQVRMVDHHGVVHGALLQDSVMVCAKTSYNGAPCGCRLDDEVGRLLCDGEPTRSAGEPCPICYPDGDQ